MIKKVLLLLLLPTQLLAQSPDLSGFGFGPAIAAVIDLDEVIISEAIIDDAGYVRGQVFRTAVTRFGLEAHAFIPLKARFGIGPFIAILPDNNLNFAAALGGMIGVRPDLDSNTSFNLGLGMMLIPGVKTLGPEFLPLNTPAPRGPNGPLTLRYEEFTQTALTTVFSASW